MNYRCELCKEKKKYVYFKTFSRWIYKHFKKNHNGANLKLKRLDNKK